MKILDKILSKKIRKGLYHYRATGEWKGLRLHLRVEEDGQGILVVNASRVLFLNKSAVEYIYLFMKGVSEEQAVKDLREDLVERFESTIEPDLKKTLDIMREFIDRIKREDNP